MLIVATAVFLYYTTWTLLMVFSLISCSPPQSFLDVVLLSSSFEPYADTPFPKPFVDQGHPLHDFFPPRVWAIRIPVILILLGSAMVGSFLSVVMIRSNGKKAAKARAADAGKKKA